MHGSVGDWRITGTDGEQWFIEPKIFERTYEPLDDEAEAAWEKAYGS